MLRHVDAENRGRAGRPCQGFGVEIESDLPPIEPRYRVGAKQRYVIFHQAGENSLAAEIALWDLIPPGTAKPFLRANARTDGLMKSWPSSMLLRDRERNWRSITLADGLNEPAGAG